jgi:hypothetical protein
MKATREFFIASGNPSELFDTAKETFNQISVFDIHDDLESRGCKRLQRGGTPALCRVHSNQTPSICIVTLVSQYLRCM